jgi:hypothetical protein
MVTNLGVSDNAVLRYQHLMQLPSATLRSKASVRNWVDGHKPLVRSESHIFLDQIEDEDFMALHQADHGFDQGLLFNLLELAISFAPRVSKMVGSSSRLWLRHVTLTDKSFPKLLSDAVSSASPFGSLFSTSVD